jgi:hypothetical protein
MSSPKASRPSKKHTTGSPKQVAAPLSQSRALASAHDVGPLVERVVAILDEARSRVVRTVNSTMVLAYWHGWREIVQFVPTVASRRSPEVSSPRPGPRSEPPARSPSSCGVREVDLQGHHQPESRRHQLAIPHKRRSHARPDALSRDTVGSPVVRTSRPPDDLVNDDRERLQLKGAPAEARLLGRDL